MTTAMMLSALCCQALSPIRLVLSWRQRAILRMGSRPDASCGCGYPWLVRLRVPLLIAVAAPRRSCSRSGLWCVMAVMGAVQAGGHNIFSTYSHTHTLFFAVVYLGSCRGPPVPNEHGVSQQARTFADTGGTSWDLCISPGT